jgi:hypothetical protein
VLTAFELFPRSNDLISVLVPAHENNYRVKIMKYSVLPLAWQKPMNEDNPAAYTCVDILVAIG